MSGKKHAAAKSSAESEPVDLLSFMDRLNAAKYRAADLSLAIMGHNALIGESTGTFASGLGQAADDNLAELEKLCEDFDAVSRDVGA